MLVSRTPLWRILMRTSIAPSIYHAVAYALLPYLRHELPGWGKFATAFGLLHDAWWQRTGYRKIVGKLHGYEMILDLDDWSDRQAYFLGRFYDLPMQLLLMQSVQ